MIDNSENIKDSELKNVTGGEGESGKKAFIDPSRCCGCEACIEYCPIGAIAPDISIKTDECVGCGLCITSCPEEAILVI